MKFFIDSSSLDIIKYYKEMGLVDGVTTNPSIIAKSGKNIFEVISGICQIIDTSVSVAVLATEFEEMLIEAHKLRSIGNQVTIKLPMTENGIRACYNLSEQNIPVNMTLCFSATQALIAAKAGAAYISPFIGRLDDIGQFGMDLISDICAIYENYPAINTQIIAASIRHPLHIIEVAKIGVDIITLPPHLLKQMLSHPLTEQGQNIFLKDGRNSLQQII